ncbi:MAG: DMSO/TMAO reductase YedYZ molybdopterin-dependent catalytic subunit [Ilumatobacter sp.]|jgi:DMSO/TMAO reductase YedYZ molybdopterin-dependent catalytic subunit
MIVVEFDGDPIEAEHGGPVRRVVPHLYFWKSAKGVTNISLSDEEDHGFCQASGCHNYGDPWREQRYSGD